MAQVQGAPAHGAVAHLLPQTYKRYISEWLEEDTPSFDYGGFVVGDEQSEAKLLGKSEVSRGCCHFRSMSLMTSSGDSSWRSILR
jgi:nicotinate-nucleotide pyrophosphorylase (carboxylating)